MDINIIGIYHEYLKRKGSFSSDGRFYLCSFDSTIVYSIANAECVRRICSLKNAFPTLSFWHPRNRSQIIIIYSNGAVVCSDFTDGEPVWQVSLQCRIDFALIHRIDSTQFSVLARTQLERPHDPSSNLMLFDVMLDISDEKRAESIKSTVVMKDCSNDETQLAVGNQFNFVVSIDGCKGRLAWINRHKATNFSSQSDITCVACHPSEMQFATGHKDGAIILWYDLQSSKFQTARLHWHSLAVQCLTFSPQGTSLLSGGSECVLVRWQLDSRREPKFLPRLAAPIRCIQLAADASLVAVHMADSSIQIISSALKTVAIIQGFCTAFHADERQHPFAVGLLRDPKRGQLVTNGRPGCLQFYSPEEDKLAYNLDVSSENYVSPRSNEKPLPLNRITCAAFAEAADTGDVWLATVEFWPGLRLESADAAAQAANRHTERPLQRHVLGGKRHWHERQRADAPRGVTAAAEQQLKIWRWHDVKNTFQLNTLAAMLAADRIHCLKFNRCRSAQSALLCATSHTGFRLWAPVLERATDATQWMCLFSGAFRQLPCYAADFSLDGTVLAVASGHTVGLWDPSSQVLKATISLADAAPQRDAARQQPHAEQDQDHTVSWLGFNQHRLPAVLVAHSRRLLAVWNLITMHCVLELAEPIQCAAMDTESDRFAVVSGAESESWKATVYDCVTCSPLASVELRQHQPLSIIFWPAGGLIGVTAAQQLVTLTAAAAPDAAPTARRLVGGTVEHESALNFLINRQKIGTVGKRANDESEVCFQKSNQIEVFNQPAYTMPPAATYCVDFMLSLLPEQRSADAAGAQLAPSSEPIVTDAHQLPVLGQHSDAASAAHQLLLPPAAAELADLHQKLPRRLRKCERRFLKHLPDYNCDWYKDIVVRLEQVNIQQ